MALMKWFGLTGVFLTKNLSVNMKLINYRNIKWHHTHLSYTPFQIQQIGFKTSTNTCGLFDLIGNVFKTKNKEKPSLKEKPKTQQKCSQNKAQKCHSKPPCPPPKPTCPPPPPPCPPKPKCPPPPSKPKCPPPPCPSSKPKCPPPPCPPPKPKCPPPCPPPPPPPCPPPKPKCPPPPCPPPKPKCPPPPCPPPPCPPPKPKCPPPPCPPPPCPPPKPKCPPTPCPPPPCPPPKPKCPPPPCPPPPCPPPKPKCPPPPCPPPKPKCPPKPCPPPPPPPCPSSKQTFSTYNCLKESSINLNDKFCATVLTSEATRCPSPPSQGCTIPPLGSQRPQCPAPGTCPSPPICPKCPPPQFKCPKSRPTGPPCPRKPTKCPSSLCPATPRPQKSFGKREPCVYSDQLTTSSCSFTKKLSVPIEDKGVPPHPASTKSILGKCSDFALGDFIPENKCLPTCSPQGCAPPKCPYT